MQNVTVKKSKRVVFLSRYDFVYPGREVINQVEKFATGPMKYTSSDINKIAQQEIN